MSKFALTNEAKIKPLRDEVNPSKTVALGFAWEDLFVGQQASFEHTFSRQDVATFSKLSGDVSPLHTDDEYASSKGYREVLLHGLLTASLISRLIGMHLPGKTNLCHSQSLDYVNPAYAGEVLRVEGRIVEKNEALRVLVIKIEIRKQNGQMVLRGAAQVGVRNE